jgi:cyclopropane-fatty-acyl-phospholipid synthase
VTTPSTAHESAKKGTRAAWLFHRLFDQTGLACEIVLPSGQLLSFGEAPASFRVTFRSNRPFIMGLDEFALARAYIEGEIDIDGDMLSVLDVRHKLSDRRKSLQWFSLLAKLFTLSPVRVNQRAIGSHYEFGDDFFLCFIDQKYRLYSHGIFHSDADSLEDASERKLKQMWNALGLRPGMRLLDIGAGWGGVTEYCGSRGVQVTSLTIAQDSYNFIRRLITERELNAEVLLQDFLEHHPTDPYDAIVILGVIEHIPNYRRFCARVWDCLRPGGLIYLDGSASREKYQMGSFARHFIWQGTHTFMCLQDLAGELLYHGMDLMELQRESRDYELTMLQWARRFDANHEMITTRWNPQLYRTFHLYLWGGCHCFRRDVLQAYHLVARRRGERGLRPGFLRRFRNFALGLA